MQLGLHGRPNAGRLTGRRTTERLRSLEGAQTIAVHSQVPLKLQSSVLWASSQQFVEHGAPFARQVLLKLREGLKNAYGIAQGTAVRNDPGVNEDALALHDRWKVRV